MRFNGGYTMLCVSTCLVLVLILHGDLFAQDTIAENQSQQVEKQSEVVQDQSEQQSKTEIQQSKTETAQQKDEAMVPVTVEKKSNEKKAESAKNEEKKSVVQQKPKKMEAIAPEQKTEAGIKIDANSLLSITDGAFRYSRIPGITLKDNTRQIADEIQPVPVATAEERGLFGLSKEASNHMAKIILVVIIILVFILYRMRTRNTKGNVLRRFPK